MVVKTYPVSFDANGHGTAPATQYVGGKITELPTISGGNSVTFGGWYKDRTCTQAWSLDTDTVTGPVTLYAKWTDRTPKSVKIHIFVLGYGDNWEDSYREAATFDYYEGDTWQVIADSYNVVTIGGDYHNLIYIDYNSKKYELCCDDNAISVLTNDTIQENIYYRIFE